MPYVKETRAFVKENLRSRFNGNRVEPGQMSVSTMLRCLPVFLGRIRHSDTQCSSEFSRKSVDKEVEI